MALSPGLRGAEASIKAYLPKVEDIGDIQCNVDGLLNKTRYACTLRFFLKYHVMGEGITPKFWREISALR